MRSMNSPLNTKPPPRASVSERSSYEDLVHKKFRLYGDVHAVENQQITFCLFNRRIFVSVLQTICLTCWVQFDHIMSTTCCCSTSPNALTRQLHQRSYQLAFVYMNIYHHRIHCPSRRMHCHYFHWRKGWCPSRFKMIIVSWNSMQTIIPILNLHGKIS